MSDRMTELLVIIERIAGGEHSLRLPLSDAHDEVDAVGHAVNVLVGELDYALTGVRTAKEQAEYAERAKTLFMRNVSHDMLTPLSAILAINDQLQTAEDLDDERRRELHGRIRWHGRQLTALVEDLVALRSLPAWARDGKAAPPPAPAPSAVLSGKRILLAEDHDDIREATRCLLELLGANVREARDGQEAVDLASGEPFDLVLMDVRMPRIDGLEATRRLRGLGVRVPIVALTADGVAEHGEECLLAGCNTHLAKPLDAERLATVLATIR